MANILILSPDNPKNAMGGLGVYVNELLKRVNSSNNNVSVLALGGQSSSYGTINVFGVAGINYNLKEPFISTLINQTNLITSAVSLINEGAIPKPDIVQSLDWSTAVAGESLSDIYNSKFILSIHLSVQGYADETDAAKIATEAEYKACLRADLITHVSHAYANSFPFFMFAQKTNVIYNGINVEDFSPKDDIDLAGDNKKKLLFIGRLAHSKNIINILNADLPAGWDLLIAGSSVGGSEELEAIIRQQAKERDNVFFLSKVTGAKKVSLMRGVDAIIYPSTEEPFGLVALEALASKTILISSFVGGMGEFLSEDVAVNCGITQSGIEEAIRKVDTMSDIEKYQRKLGGTIRANSLSWESSVRNMEQIWNDLSD